MKSQELRIGNYIYNDDSEITEVFGISGRDQIYDLDDNIYFSSEFKPIPLTEQWLKDFGLSKGTSRWIIFDGDSYPKTTLKLAHLDSYYGSYHPKELWQIMENGDDYTIGEPFKYVHQLQNLYFALTGKELIKNLDK